MVHARRLSQSRKESPNGNQMQTEVKVTTDAIDVSQLESVELPDGWHDITGCELVQFALGESA